MSEIEQITARVLRSIAERGEATDYLTRTGALVEACRALLAAVDFRCDGHDRDVRVRDLWGAAYALRRIERLLAETP